MPHMTTPPAPSTSTCAHVYLSTQANPDAQIECVPSCLPEDGSPPLHRPTTAGDHVMRKFAASQKLD